MCKAIQSTPRQPTATRTDSQPSTEKGEDVSTSPSPNLDQVLQEETGEQPAQCIRTLNQAARGGWSYSLETSSEREQGIGELLRTIINLGDSPRIGVKATITIHAADRSIKREGFATGSEDSKEKTEKAAVANAILTLKT